MSKQAGPTEARVRGALLRLWEKLDSGVHEYDFHAETVRAAANRDGGKGGSLTDEAVMRSGRRTAQRAGKGIDCTPSGWSRLGDGLEYTYSRGVFTVRRKPAEAKAAESKAARDRLFADRDPNPPPHPTARSEDPEIKTRNVLGSDDATIQVTWGVEGKDTALLTVRGKDHDLTPEQLRAFAAALLEAAAAIDGGDTSVISQVHEIGMLAARAFGEPRVTKRHLDLMRHATGGKLRAVRNYSISPPGHEWHQDWTELVGMGLAGEGEPPDCSEAGQRKGTVFHVTEAGFRMTYGDVRKPGKRGKR